MRVIWNHFHFEDDLKPGERARVDIQPIFLHEGKASSLLHHSFLYYIFSFLYYLYSLLSAPFLSLLYLFPLIICTIPFLIIFSLCYLHQSFLYYLYSLFFIICIIPFFIINLFSIVACYRLYGWRTNFNNLEAIWS